MMGSVCILCMACLQAHVFDTATGSVCLLHPADGLRGDLAGRGATARGWWSVWPTSTRERRRRGFPAGAGARPRPGSVAVRGGAGRCGLTEAGIATSDARA